MHGHVCKQLYSGPVTQQLYSGPVTQQLYSGPVTHLLSVLCVLMKILSHASAKRKTKRLTLQILNIYVLFSSDIVAVKALVCLCLTSVSKAECFDCDACPGRNRRDCYFSTAPCMCPCSVISRLPPVCPCDVISRLPPVCVRVMLFLDCPLCVSV